MKFINYLRNLFKPRIDNKSIQVLNQLLTKERVNEQLNTIANFCIQQEREMRDGNLCNFTLGKDNGITEAQEKLMNELLIYHETEWNVEIIIDIVTRYYTIVQDPFSLQKYLDTYES